VRRTAHPRRCAADRRSWTSSITRCPTSSSGSSGRTQLADAHRSRCARPAGTRLAVEPERPDPRQRVRWAAPAPGPVRSEVGDHQVDRSLSATRSPTARSWSSGRTSAEQRASRPRWPARGRRSRTSHRGGSPSGPATATPRRPARDRDRPGGDMRAGRHQLVAGSGVRPPRRGRPEACCPCLRPTTSPPPSGSSPTTSAASSPTRWRQPPVPRRAGRRRRGARRLDVTGYAARRNEVWPAERRGATAVSPYVRHGLLRSRAVGRRRRRAARDRSRYRDELLWQEYARHLYARLGGPATGCGGRPAAGPPPGTLARRRARCGTRPMACLG
jgi:hypothetical protein